MESFPDGSSQSHYEEIDRLMFAIKTSNRSLLNSSLEALRNIQKQENLEDMDKDAGSLRLLKNLLISRINTCRIAAYEAGVPAQLVHETMVSCLREVERATSVEALHPEFAESFFHVFFDLVEMYAMRNYSKVVKTAINYIVEKLDGDLGLNAIAEHLHVNPSHLSRAFKKETGRNISEYVTHLRIDRAKKYLQTTDYPITKISELVGFNSTSYFCVKFKEVTGYTPSEYHLDTNGHN